MVDTLMGMQRSDGRRKAVDVLSEEAKKARLSRKDREELTEAMRLIRRYLEAVPQHRGALGQRIKVDLNEDGSRALFYENGSVRFYDGDPKSRLIEGVGQIAHSVYKGDIPSDAVKAVAAEMCRRLDSIEADTKDVLRRLEHEPDTYDEP